jgi:hypothetical protein
MWRTHKNRNKLVREKPSSFFCTNVMTLKKFFFNINTMFNTFSLSLMLLKKARVLVLDEFFSNRCNICKDDRSLPCLRFYTNQNKLVKEKHSSFFEKHQEIEKSFFFIIYTT